MLILWTAAAEFRNSNLHMQARHVEAKITFDVALTRCCLVISKRTVYIIYTYWLQRARQGLAGMTLGKEVA